MPGAGGDGDGDHGNRTEAKSQRELILASLKRDAGKDNAAGAKHGHGSSK